MSRMTPEQVIAGLERTVPVIQEEAVKAMRKAVDLTAERMSELAPKGATGKLSRDLQRSTHQTIDGVNGTVRPRARYAGWVDGGTGEGKSVRAKTGEAYTADGLRRISRAEELADPFNVRTASGFGSKTPGKPLALHVKGGVVFREHVRGQRARHFVERTREATADNVEEILAQGAANAAERLFP